MQLEIKKGWFRTAGKQFKWSNLGYDIRGVGIDMRILKSSPRLVLVIENEPYVLDTEQGLAFIRKFSATYQANSVKLGVISKSILKPLKSTNSAEKEAIDEPKQQSLF